MPGLVALVDCNNFYASCERLFQPELNGKPVVVLSNNDGCVIARSNEAKALGIKMGDAYHLRKREFAAWGVQVYSSNYTLYGDISARVMRVLGEFTPELEVYSIDEAFLDVSGALRLLGSGVEIAQQIRRSIASELDLQCSVGVAPNKFIAKPASKAAKPIAGPQGVRPGPGLFCQSTSVGEVVRFCWY